MQIDLLLEIFGGREEAEKIREWGQWYGARWWNKKRGRQTPFAKALKVGLAAAKLLNEWEEARLPPKPRTPLNSYVAEHVELLEAFDEVVEIIEGVEENSIEIMWSGLQVQNWRLQVARLLMRGMDSSKTILEPLPGDGVLAALAAQELGLKNYIGYGPRIELAALVSPQARYFRVISACEIMAHADVALLLEKIVMFTDPVRELTCIHRLLRPGGIVVVAEPDAAASPAYAAILVALRALRAVTGAALESFLSSAGFKLREGPLIVPPYHISVWKKIEGGAPKGEGGKSPHDVWVDYIKRAHGINSY